VLKPPFKGNHNARTLSSADSSDTWLARGEVTPKKYFLRLANPNSETAGGVFSPRRLGAREVAAVLSFRAAGPADQGSASDVGQDGGAALWFANQIVPNADNFALDLRDVSQKGGAFYGLGVIARASGVVSVVLANKEAPEALATARCGALRFRSTRADYHPAKNETKLRVLIEQVESTQLELTVRIDDGSGFKTCVEDLRLPAPLLQGWLRDAYVGATGATAAGDVVDLVKLSVTGKTDRSDVAEDVEEAMRRLDAATKDALHPTRDGLSFEERAARVETALAALAANFDDLAAAIEHAALGKTAALEGLLEQDRAHQEDMVDSLVALEKELTAEGHNHLEERIGHLEEQIRDGDYRAHDDFIGHVVARLRRYEQRFEDELRSVGKGWVGVIVFVILVVHVAAAVFVYRSYAEMKKAKVI